MVEEDSKQEKAPTAPYLPFATFQTSLSALEQGVPRKIDKGLWRSQAGGTQTQIMNTLRFLGGVDANGVTQRRLDDLIAAQGDERKRIFREMLAASYPAVIELVPQNASLKALEDAITALGLTGDTMRKGVTFFIRAAEWSELPISPHWRAATKRGPRRAAGTSSTRRPRRKKTEDGGNGGGGGAKPAVEQPTTPTIDALKTRYIEMLMKKAESEADTELLDRIETLLGFPTDS